MPRAGRQDTSAMDFRNFPELHGDISAIQKEACETHPCVGGYDELSNDSSVQYMLKEDSNNM